jgi:1-acyl-sn-glycerol-3-phosphate acyltransferase
MAVVLQGEEHGGAAAPSRVQALAGRLGRILRSLGHVVLFIGFGLLALFYWGWVVPTTRLRFRDPTQRTEVARAWARRMVRLTTDAAQALRLIDVEVSGLDKLAPGSLIVANHPTLIDAFFFLGRVPGAVPIAKRALLANPCVAPAIRLANYVINDSGRQMVEDCVSRLRAGETLILFPEGTRTTPGQPLLMRRGAAQVALRAERPLVPVTIRLSDALLGKGGKWYLAPVQRPRFTLVVHPAIDVGRYLATGARPTAAARELTDDLQQFFTRELARRGAA